MKKFIWFQTNEEFELFQKEIPCNILEILPHKFGITVIYTDKDDLDELNLPMTLTIQGDEEIKRAITGNNMCKAIYEFQQYLRDHIKYNNENLNDDQLKIVKRISDKFYEILSDENVNLDDIWS